VTGKKGEKRSEKALFSFEGGAEWRGERWRAIFFFLDGDGEKLFFFSERREGKKS